MKPLDRWEKIIDTRTETRVVTTKVFTDGGTEIEKTEESKVEYVITETQNAGYIVRYNGLNIGIIGDVYFGSSCINLAIESATLFCNRYSIGFGDPLHVEVLTWFDRTEYTVAGEDKSFFDDHPRKLYNKTDKEIEKSEDVVVWSSHHLKDAGFMSDWIEHKSGEWYERPGDEESNEIVIYNQDGRVEVIIKGDGELYLGDNKQAAIRILSQMLHFLRMESNDE